MNDVRGIVGKFSLIAALAASLFVTGCASTSGGSTADNDPYEQTNRDIFAFNQVLDENVAPAGREILCPTRCRNRPATASTMS